MAIGVILALQTARAESQRQWAAAHTEMQRRAEEILAALPSFLATRIPDSMAKWPKDFLVGTMLDYTTGRYWRAQEASEALSQAVGAIIEEARSDATSSDAIRSLVAEARLKIDQANAARKEQVRPDAEKFANYVRDHMRMRFRPYGRDRLLSAVGLHLTALLENQMPKTLLAEERLGRLELGCADQIDAEIAESGTQLSR